MTVLPGFEDGADEYGDRTPLAALCTVAVVTPNPRQTAIRMIRHPERHPDGRASREPNVGVVYDVVDGVARMTPEDAAAYLAAAPGAQPAQGPRLPLTDSWSIERREEMAREERRAERLAERQAARMRRELRVAP